MERKYKKLVMLKFKPVINKVIQKLGIFKEELINDLSNPELEQLKIRVANSFDTMSRALSVATGGTIEKLDGNQQEFKPEPLKKLLDMDIDKGIKTTTESVNPRQEEIDQIKQEVSDAYEGFVDRDSSEILDSVEELIIRGVAKRAGLTVDANTPEKITVPFIDEIKEAIIVQRENGDVVNDTDLSVEQIELIKQLIVEALKIYNDRALALDYDEMTQEQALELTERMTGVAKVGDDPREVLKQFIDSLPELMPERDDNPTNHNGEPLTDDLIMEIKLRVDEAIHGNIPKEELIQSLQIDYEHVSTESILKLIDEKVTELLESGVEIPNALELGYITDDQLGEPFIDDGTLTREQIANQLLAIELTDNASEDERHRLDDIRQLGFNKLKRMKRDELIEHLTFFLNN